MNKKRSKKVFETMINLGFNPLAFSYTTYINSNENYEKYAKKRLSIIKAGKDKMFKLVNQFCYKIVKK